MIPIRAAPRPQISDSTRLILESLVSDSYEPQPMRKNQVRMEFGDPNSTTESQVESLYLRKNRSRMAVAPEEDLTLEKSMLKVLNGTGKDAPERLAFEADPRHSNTYASVYKSKLKLIPDHILKRIAIQDDLVASIVNTRAAQLQSFGRPQPDRFSTGFKFTPDKGIEDKMNVEEKKAFEKRVNAMEKKLITCGPGPGDGVPWRNAQKCTFGQFLGMAARNAVTVGRIAVEFIWGEGDLAEEVFQGFRVADAGTIYRAAPYQHEADAVRKEAVKLLEDLKNEKLKVETFTKDEYAWIQVIDGKPVQAFTEKEMVVHNFYPVADVELDGYPVTPIDTAIAAITTHINITTHNRLFFQQGRAARGMLVITSNDVDEQILARIKHQYQASINNVANSWRLPVFALSQGDEIEFIPTDSQQKDMEFQYLSDTNARVIMSAFQISPEELPGYQHLSRGTNNQALSESNNEYKLEAARDVGIRPLIANFEEFINTQILPLLDETLAKMGTIKFVGLDAETPEKENVRLQEAMQTHMTFDDVQQAVEKEPMGPQMGGTIPLNALYNQVLDSHFTMGVRLAYFTGNPELADPQKHPELDYMRDPFHFQQKEFLMNQQQMQQQAQQQQMQAAGGAPPGGDPNAQPQPGQDGQAGPPQDLSTGLDQAIGMMSKSEAQLPPSRRRLAEQHRTIVSRAVSAFDEDLKNLGRLIADEVDDHLPPKE